MKELTYAELMELYPAWQDDLELEPDTPCLLYSDGSASFYGTDGYWHTLCEGDEND